MRIVSAIQRGVRRDSSSRVEWSLGSPTMATRPTSIVSAPAVPLMVVVVAAALLAQRKMTPAIQANLDIGLLLHLAMARNRRAAHRRQLRAFHIPVVSASATRGRAAGARPWGPFGR